jgi:tetratricopeptide (TPR) repeat protein
MLEVPVRLQRLACEVEGWVELGCWAQALDRLAPLLDEPASRPAALELSVRALVGLGRHDAALAQLAELRQGAAEREWLELTEAWCRKRTGDLPGAAACMERLVAASHRSAIGHFNLGCYLALLGQRERALDEVTLACGLDPDFRRSLAGEPDLDSLRDDPRFQALAAAASNGP